MQLGSTKSWVECQAAINRTGRIRRVDERETLAEYLVASDKQTFHFIYHLVRSNPSRYDWVRLCVSVWHLLLHITKAFLKRYSGARVELVVRNLGTGSKKVADGGNYRQSYHHLCVFNEGMWFKLVHMCITMSNGNARTRPRPMSSLPPTIRLPRLAIFSPRRLDPARRDTSPP